MIDIAAVTRQYTTILNINGNLCSESALIIQFGKEYILMLIVVKTRVSITEHGIKDAPSTERD